MSTTTKKLIDELIALAYETGYYSAKIELGKDGYEELHREAINRRNIAANHIARLLEGEQLAAQ